MAQRTYKDKLETVNLWVEIINHHWHRLMGELYNDTEAWDDIFHAMKPQDHRDWVEIEPALRALHPEIFEKYYHIRQGTEYLNKRLMFGKPIFKQGVKHQNREGFKAWMNIKDIINEINGTPTRQYTDSERRLQRESEIIRPFDRLFSL